METTSNLSLLELIHVIIKHLCESHNVSPDDFVITENVTTTERFGRYVCEYNVNKRYIQMILNEDELYVSYIPSHEQFRCHNKSMETVKVLKNPPVYAKIISIFF